MSRKTEHLAVAFVKIGRSRSLLEELGTDAALDRIHECMALVREQTEANEGHEIKTITGDTVMCRYPGAEQAMNAATGILTELPDRLGDDLAHELSVGIGFAFGPMLVEQGDAFGHTVHIAARLASEAKGGQILTNRESAETLPARLKNATRHIDNMPVKGIQEPIEVCEVLWEEQGMTQLKARPADEPEDAASLELACAGTKLLICADRPSAVLGRGADVDLRVPETDASRRHARIEQRRGKFLLTDESRNGTWIKVGDEVVQLRRGEHLTLSGDGVITLGRDPSSATCAVHFAHRD